MPLPWVCSTGITFSRSERPESHQSFRIAYTTHRMDVGVDVLAHIDLIFQIQLDEQIERASR